MLKQGIIKEKLYKAWLESPIFVYNRTEALTDQEIEWCRQNLCDPTNEAPVLTKLPFEFFSVITRVKDEPGKPDLSSVMRVIGKPHEFTVKEEGGIVQHSCVMATLMWFKIDGVECLLTARYTGKVKGGVIISTHKNGKLFDTQKERYKDLSHSVAVVRDILMKFCFDVFNPNSVVVRVEPPKTVARSVEWTMAHTHYLILNRKQAIACRDQKRGPTEGEIERAAHWRRAHLRRLSSERFTHKKGLLVFVKQAWIGPEEWIGLDDKTYKVINPKPITP